MADNYLITGYWGEPHVTAENDRGINAAVFGAGKFVLPVGEMFRAEYIGNNTVRIYDGKLLDNGAAAGIPAGKYIDLLIPEAGQGMNRNDLIIFQYSQDNSTLVESGVFTVLSGEETVDAAIDPMLHEEDLLTDEAALDQMALWRVPVSGANISDPVRLFKVSRSASDIMTIAPNLLDNSDFRKMYLVNQRGFAGGAPSADNVYFIDRWKTQQNTTKNIEINLSDSGLTIHVSTGLAGIAQRIPAPKTDVTFAAKVNGEIVFVHAKHGEDASVKTEDNVLLYVEWTDNVLQVIIRNTGEEANTYTVKWAALYEGEYTAETLPEYQPKGYGAELAECQRYYIHNVTNCIGMMTGTVAYMFLPLPVDMRVTPSLTNLNIGTLRGAGQSITPTEITITGKKGNGLSVNMTYGTVNNISNHVAVWTGSCSISADL